MTTTAITGSTGNVGGAVARQLASHGVPLTLIVRDASRAPALPDCEVATASYANEVAMVSALSGIDVLFMVSAHENATRLDEHRAVVRSAVGAGVRHIVYTSFVGASHDSGFTLGRDHAATEQAIRDSGIDFTFLRDNFYLDLLPEFADENGVIRGPAGTGRIAAVARADVADVATVVLKSPERHRRTSYDLTGREAITFSELATRVTNATGRLMSFHNETVDEAYASRARFGAETWQLDAWVSTYTAIRDGELAAISGDVRALTGHEPRVLEDLFGR
jgi:NAD(P)H dehydrogenase (quinone)